MESNLDKQITEVATDIYTERLGTKYNVAEVPAHTHNGVDTTLLPIQSITGYFPQVTTTPTLSPNSFWQSLAVDTTTGTIYYYDFTNRVWKSVLGATTTATLTNKRITKRTGTTTSSATPTINTDNVDFYSITALSTAITSFTTNLSGTPTEAQTLWLAITDNGTARALTFGASFEASGTVALPTTTVVSTRLDILLGWNTVTSKWRCLATA